MAVDRLEPRLDILRQEYVLVQAWKKTAAYIRSHNWFSDTLELDRAAVNFPAIIAEIAELLQFPDRWENDPLRIVPAPKSQRWRMSPITGAWEPTKEDETAARLRPLAHVSLKDQIVATAVMLCVADRVETRQGDPRRSIRDSDSRRKVVSYGNRLFCDKVGGELRHRWGSTKLYRTYYQDYRTFLSRPEVVAESAAPTGGQRIIIVRSDLRQFYDRVRPDRLAGALSGFLGDDDDRVFFEFAKRVLDWRWDPRDKREVAIYAEQTGVGDFSRVALPQGLVSAGFFANIALLEFDDMLRSSVKNEIAPSVHLEDACRYVDDLRVVVTAKSDKNLQRVEDEVQEWLEHLLVEEASGLELSTEKTKATEFDGGERSPLVRQSKRMNRIQSAISGGFDAVGGEVILDAIQGLIRSQQTLTQQSDEGGWRFSPLPDVPDDTAARFAAARFRTTFRSLRPLLEEGSQADGGDPIGNEEPQSDRSRHARSQRDVDDEAHAFALALIERWVEDPSNVRLLRIGLDLWPDAEVLTAVLDLLRPSTEEGGRYKASRRVAWYCLSEILRAGATETGFVEDDECLPAGLDLAAYRTVLRDQAARLVPLPASSIPWYLRQQALLFLAVHDPHAAPVVHSEYSVETQHYHEMIRFLRGESGRLKSAHFATLAVLSRRVFHDRKRAAVLVRQGLTPARQREIAKRDPSFALELIESGDLLVDGLPARLREDLCLQVGPDRADLWSLSDVVLRDGPEGPLRNELTLLRFAAAFLQTLQEMGHAIEVIAPQQVRLRLRKEDAIADVVELKIVASRVAPGGSMYRPPQWCPEPDRWRFQLGFLMRFILTGQPDFTRHVRPSPSREGLSVYRPAESHWYERIYGLFNGQPAFGDDWLPITDWMEQFLSALLHWPGCRAPDLVDWVRDGIWETLRHIRERILKLESKQGSSTGLLVLPMVASRPSNEGFPRPLRACVVQTVIPGEGDFGVPDLTLASPSIRKRHRNHLSAALAAVERMLALRETHKGNEGRLDWLILPELAVHPHDVSTHLLPFARAHRAIILAGLTYEELFSGQPLVNSALWLMPEWTAAHGLQLRTRRQGKRHLAPNEECFNGSSTRLRGFRPCQWLIGYPWSDDSDQQLVWLTASVCYDATDLGLAADLRNESDILAIPALNKDVRTFDQMALALHYHMFQLVVVANNGQYGGSNAYWPSSNIHSRQVFHLHGQPQASIAFLEIEDIEAFLKRRHSPVSGTSRWKYPPAGLE